mmetsp:Transcript_12440/g.18124  ORF Transcript_12440/g.18124 Transcript_12440/m.18124 type:complete len:100 (+) Transcript_12440:1880-2179(+)
MVVVHTTCIAIGMEATKSTTQIERASKKSVPFEIATIKMMITKTEETTSKNIVTLKITFWKFPELFTEPTRAEVLPKNVRAPVADTMASRSPLLQTEPW